MRILATIQLVLSLLAVLGSARPDGEVAASRNEDHLLNTVANSISEGEEVSGTIHVEAVEVGVSSCPVEKGASNLTEGAAFEVFANQVNQCILRGGDELTREQLRGANSTEEYQEVISGYCRKLPTITECIVKTTEQAKRCLVNETDYNVVKTQSRIAQLLVEVSCEQGSYHMSNILMDIKRFPTSWKDVTHVCMKLFKIELSNIYSTTVELSLLQYKTLMNFKECVIEVGRKGHREFKDLLHLTDKVIAKLNCDDSEPNVETLCKTIVERQCTDDPLEMKIVSNRAVDCYFSNKDKADMKRRFRTALKTEEYQTFFNDLCTKDPSFNGCFSEARMIAEHCLHDNESLDVFRGTTYLHEKLFDFICADNGSRLSNILTGMNSGVNVPDFLETCLRKAAQDAQRDYGDVSDFRFAQFHMLTNFKTCLAERGAEHGQGLNSAATFLGDVVNTWTCIDEKTHGYVLCNTIQNNS